MNCIEKKDDWRSFYLILIRGYYYFLNRKRSSIQQDKIESYIQNFCGENTDFYTTGFTLKVDKDVIDDSESYERYNETNPETTQPIILSAGDAVLSHMLSEVNNKGKSELSLLNCGVGLNPTDDNSLFLAISKIIYGSSHYYINLRLFLCFYYRSLSKLSRHHIFYKKENITSVVSEILERVCEDNDFPMSVYLPDSDRTLDPSKFPKIFLSLSYHLMNDDSAAEYHDLYIFASMFGVEFIVIEGRSYQFQLPENVQQRDWKIHFQRTYNGNEFINQCLQKVQPRPKKWLVCMFESQFMPLVENKEDNIADDITFSIPTVGLNLCNNDESNLFILSQGPATPSKDMLHHLSPYLQKEPFKIQRNIQRMFNAYTDSTTIKKFVGKGNYGIPNYPGKKYGKILSCANFVEAGVPEEYTMACVRCLDPPRILVDQKIWPISNKCQFEDLMRFRIDTWLNETCCKLFIEYVSSLTEKYYFLDPATFNDSIGQIATLIKLINTKGFEVHTTKDILVLLRIKDHFIVAEIRRSEITYTEPTPTNEEPATTTEASTPNNEDFDGIKTPIYMACSLGQGLSTLVKQVEECHFDVFLNILIGRESYEYKLANNVRQQDSTTSSECGVFCLQRLFQYALYGDVTKELSENLQSPINFRCYMLYKILEFNRKTVSPYVLYNEDTYCEYIPTSTMFQEDHQGKINCPIDINTSGQVNTEGEINTQISAQLLKAVQKEIQTSEPVPVLDDYNNKHIPNQKSDETPSVKEVQTFELENHPPNLVLEYHGNEISTSDKQNIQEASSTVIQEVPKETRTSTENGEEITSDIQKAALQSTIISPKGMDLQLPASPPTIQSLSLKRNFAAITQIDDGDNDFYNSSSSTVTEENKLQRTIVDDDKEDNADEVEQKNNKDEEDGIDDGEDGVADDDDITKDEDDNDDEEDDKINDKERKQVRKIKVMLKPKNIIKLRRRVIDEDYDDDKDDKVNEKENDDDDDDEDYDKESEDEDNDGDNVEEESVKKQVKPKPIAKTPKPKDNKQTTNVHRNMRKRKINFTPTRFSERIKLQKEMSPITTVPKKLTVRPRNPRDPRNFAVGFSVNKAPRTLTEATKKHLQRVQIKKDKLDARIALFDKLQECNDEINKEDLIEEPIIDFYINDERYFINKKLKDSSLSEKEKNQPNVFLPKLYNRYQHSKNQLKK